jgi:hypothetical protein
MQMLIQGNFKERPIYFSNFINRSSWNVNVGFCPSAANWHRSSNCTQSRPRVIAPQNSLQWLIVPPAIAASVLLCLGSGQTKHVIMSQ